MAALYSAKRSREPNLSSAVNRDMATDNERPPIESLAIEEMEIEPEGEGHVDNDERTYREQVRDPLGQNGPSYEANQAWHGREVRPGGSTDPNNSLSHSDSGDES
jgi:hypothetical protein